MLLKVIWLGLAAVITLLVTGGIMRKRRHAALVKTLREGWGRWRDRDRDLQAIAAYHRALVTNGLADGSLDDRTWDDLNMDAVFTRVDRTESVIGQQLLYHRLRGAPAVQPLEAFEALVNRMSAEAATREAAQSALSSLRDTGGYDLWVIAQPGSMTVEPWFVIFPMMATVMVLTVVAIPFVPPAVLMLIVGAVAGIVLRSTIAKHVRLAVGAFRQIGPLLGAAEGLRSIAGPAEGSLVTTLQQDVARLARLKRISSWVSRDASAAVAGDLAGMLIEYLNLLFLDANALFFGARELRRRGPELLRVLAAVGDIDAAVSVASYRSSLAAWTRPSFQPAGSPAVMTQLRHPLIPDGVTNSITLGPPNGVIITGSNMSGKTTFLRTVGVNAVLAQTINTCLAETYEAPAFVVRSCIGRTDDLLTGKSYYLVEVDSVLALVRASESVQPHLFLFDEMFRGTNAVERIAAGEAVLAELLSPRADGASRPHIVLAATHDQELVDLLNGLYAPFHFTDTIDDAGLSFDYRLLSGPATTRNAIALLRLRGAPEALVSHALARASALDNARRRHSEGPDMPDPHKTPRLGL